MKTIGKVLLWILLTALILFLLGAAAAGVKYYRVVHSEAAAELISGPERSRSTEPVRLGQKFELKTEFRLPWGMRPLSLTPDPAPGSQLTAPPRFTLTRYGWGSNLWSGIIPLQCYREGTVKEAAAQAVFSNRQTISLKLPAFLVEPPEMKGDQLELAGEIELKRKADGNGMLLWGLVGLLILAALTLLALRFMKRERKRVLSPWEKALSAIQMLLENVRTGNVPPESSIARLTDIVREYMERRFRLRAERQTTGEFMADLERGKGGLNRRHRDFLRDFLTAADMVKFAKVPADKTLFENAAVKAEELIRETTPGEAGKGKGKEKEK